jgi:hypothetical protein
MVPGGGKSILDPPEHSPPVMAYHGGSSMHQRWCMNDSSPVRKTDRLMSEADTENRYLRSEGSNRLHRYSRIFRPAGSWGEENASRSEGTNPFHINLVVADDRDVPGEPTKQLDQIECKRIVVVNNQDHRADLVVISSAIALSGL